MHGLESRKDSVAVNTKNNWREIYESSNPLKLPKAIRRQLRPGVAPQIPEGVKHLWIVISREGVQLGKQFAEGGAMNEEAWLNLIDEAAGIGVNSIVVSVGTELSSRPEVWAICQWAQETYDMLVGLHLTVPNVTPADEEHLRKLKPENTFVFAHSSVAGNFRHLQNVGIRVFEADGLEDGAEQGLCTLPGEMVCVGGEGTMYTCGLVVEEKEFEMGDVRGDRVDKALADENLPHRVPAGHSNATHRCDGCPPLLERRMRRAAGR